MTQRQHTDTLIDLLAPYAAQAETDLQVWLVERGTPETLAEAMRYCALCGGKRLRPALVLISAHAVSGRHDEHARRAAVAVELVHCYSLVHDDLPAMDDDILRRGMPTAHVKFGEAMAILAGDALLTRAFGLLAEIDSPIAPRLATELARGAGAAGMIAGQVADMNLCQLPAGPDGLRYIHMHKTTALIRAATRMGAICGNADQLTLSAATEYAESLGLAFQLIDDILDVTGQAADIGKTPGKDAQAGKRTYPGEIGLDASLKLAANLTSQAIKSLAPLGNKASVLESLARLLAERTH